MIEKAYVLKKIILIINVIKNKIKKILIIK